MKEAIGEAIARLPEREKLVVTLYYYEELTLREIGEVLGVTESRVSQLHTKAILRLKARLSGGPRARASSDAGVEAQAAPPARLGPLRPRPGHRVVPNVQSRAPAEVRRWTNRHDLLTRSNRRGQTLPGSAGGSKRPDKIARRVQPTDQEERSAWQQSSPARSATSPSSDTAARGRRRSSRRCSSSPGRSTGSATIEAGSTVADWDDDERRRQMSLSAAALPRRLAGPQDQPRRHARRPRLPGRRDRRAPRRRGRPLRRQRRDGRRGRDEPALEARERARPLPRPLRQHARPRARRLLPRASRRCGAALRALRRRPPADRQRARADRHRRPAAHDAPT